MQNASDCSAFNGTTTPSGATVVVASDTALNTTLNYTSALNYSSFYVVTGNTLGVPGGYYEPTLTTRVCVQGDALGWSCPVCFDLGRATRSNPRTCSPSAP